MKNHLQQLIEESERLKNLPSIPKEIRMHPSDIEELRLREKPSDSRCSRPGTPKELEAPYSLSSVLVVPDYNVPRLPRKATVAHTLEKHTNCSQPGSCPICDGGLAVCTVCKGAGGSLPSECPGSPMSADQSDRVYAGEIDFKSGVWRQK